MATECPIPAGSVVPSIGEVSEAEFRVAVLGGLAICSKTEAGRRTLAAHMDLTLKGLSNILQRDAMPSHKRMWDATLACPSAMDEVAKLYGKRLVPLESEALSDECTLPLATLLAKVAEAESPASAGGTKKTHQELLAMEPDVRRVRAICDAILEEIAKIRGPRAVA